MNCELPTTSHIEDSPGYLYRLDKDGNVFQDYVVEVEDIQDKEPLLVEYGELNGTNI